nr:MAG TPA: hypothetical protein [Herelleviridae sp.]
MKSFCPEFFYKRDPKGATSSMPYYISGPESEQAG